VHTKQCSDGVNCKTIISSNSWQDIEQLNARGWAYRGLSVKSIRSCADLVHFALGEGSVGDAGILAQRFRAVAPNSGVRRLFFVVSQKLVARIIDGITLDLWLRSLARSKCIDYKFGNVQLVHFARNLAKTSSARLTLRNGWDRPSRRCKFFAPLAHALFSSHKEQRCICDRDIFQEPKWRPCSPKLARSTTCF
jgi:hypothetical protein